MVKKNYTKVENLFSKGMEDLKVEHLLDLAIAAQESKNTPSQSLESQQTEPSQQTKQSEQSQKSQQTHQESRLTPRQRLTIIEQNMIWMKNQNKKKYEKLNIKRGILKKYLQKGELSVSEIEEIIALQEKISTYKKENYPEKADDDLVELERLKHINKRHNVNDKWLPLQ